MTRIIPRSLIRHLEWVPGQPVPETQSPVSTLPVAQRGAFSIDALVQHGGIFYSNEKDSSNRYIGVAVALERALEGIASGGVIASLPYLVAGKATSERDNYLWQNWFTSLTEEDVGIDRRGTFVAAGNPVVITLHGGGVLMPSRIRQAYDEGLTRQNAAQLRDDEFDNLLQGILPNGEKIQMYTLEEVKRGIPDPFGRYAVATDFETAKGTRSNYFKKDAFMSNPLVLARLGTLEHAEQYFNKAKNESGDVGNWHPFHAIDTLQAQGRLLFLDLDYYGLDGLSDLNDSGRFVGVGAGGAL